MSSPVYIQIHNQLRKNIEDGKWKVGEKIPAERELANDFSVSRMTLRQAIQALVDEGILERRVGSGTFVANRKVQEKMSGVTSFTELMDAMGKKAASKTISYHLTIPSQTEVEKLKLGPDEQVLRMERVRYGNEVPICYEIATVPASLVQQFSKEEITTSFYRTLEEKANLYPGHAIQHISATKATEKIASYLQIKRGDALLRMTQLSYLQDGRPFEYVHTQYVGSRFEFVFEK
ncbi:GntR family transcriptional regulator [Limosilactobacillus sp. RRLNB_1_1]|uniref:GntR family transcriptional regulator n=1 Tax=Limosilactobacillus albertensis TaxID=2759752 RepID=A0A7W3TTL2_9LACO|nr:GntR family transcriptional regulator [Limosilactobacillus albertensis]MBB1070488.1 GntR family transcriptional regulator [Limosilactobacillus albertensis]MBB1122927.1 GntR family transcriptional regulator [Limosilactobacillus albertensis]MCD7118869.1 GntR family transcriptional regulator [Limosilactobacillus albertensis]MCD7121171.1 GntR family transcriptional regulator [Limosilactobacillus albertensis]MCD7129006.1 GntR family transcriptional regulator [Limosilactobacillus albertensis]